MADALRFVRNAAATISDASSSSSSDAGADEGIATSPATATAKGSLRPNVVALDAANVLEETLRDRAKQAQTRVEEARVQVTLAPQMPPSQEGHQILEHQTLESTQIDSSARILINYGGHSHRSDSLALGACTKRTPRNGGHFPAVGITTWLPDLCLEPVCKRTCERPIAARDRPYRGFCGLPYDYDYYYNRRSDCYAARTG